MRRSKKIAASRYVKSLRMVVKVSEYPRFGFFWSGFRGYTGSRYEDPVSGGIARGRSYIVRLTPSRISIRLTGSAAKNPHSMAICIINQKVHPVRGNVSPEKNIKNTRFIQPYIPACHAVSDRKSASPAFISASPGEMRCMLRIAAY